MPSAARTTSESALKVYERKFVPFINFCAPRQFRLPGQSLRRAAGRRTGALFFCSAPRLFHRDM
jgi:hypothetical protein